MIERMHTEDLLKTPTLYQSMSAYQSSEHQATQPKSPS